MPWYQALTLGAAQGLTEFWPISSSAHFALLLWLTGWGEPRLSFNLALHAGTLLAVVVYFRTALLRLLAAAWRILVERKVGEERDRLMASYLFVAALPALAVGAFAADSADMMAAMPLLIVLAMFLFSLVLWQADRAARLELTAADLGWRGSLVTGVFQVLAMIPGVSRSGATVSAGLLQGLTREEAVEFAFLLSVPTIGAAFAFSCLKMVGEGVPEGTLGPMLLGAGASFLTGILAIAFLLRRVKARDLKPFVAYRIALAAALLVVYFVR